MVDDRTVFVVRTSTLYNLSPLHYGSIDTDIYPKSGSHT